MGRKNISLSHSAQAQADELIRMHVADGLSELITRLIRDEYDRRGLTEKHIEIAERPTPYGANSPTVQAAVEDVVDHLTDKATAADPSKP